MVDEERCYPVDERLLARAFCEPDPATGTIPVRVWPQPSLTARRVSWWRPTSRRWPG